MSDSFATPWTVANRLLCPWEFPGKIARRLEWIAISYSRLCSWPRDKTQVSSIGRWILYPWAIREVLLYKYCWINKLKFFPENFSYMTNNPIIIKAVWREKLFFFQLCDIMVKINLSNLSLFCSRKFVL